ncbi:MAG: DUF2203 domain-containing protein [Ignavibacteria bacterium]|nr:DUF2203 domain-containing protein [Ignavibacteria bacterium]
MAEVKYFTPKEAVKTLPLVKKIVDDILREGKDIQFLMDQVGGDVQLNPEIPERLKSMQVYLKELLEVGCYYKDWDFSLGLVDFPSVIDGEEVFLCWRSDEETISYYHHPASGYAGRKVIPEDYFL